MRPGPPGSRRKDKQMSILKFDNVSKSFGEGTAATSVLKNIDLEVQEGEFLVLLGFSGTGTSSFGGFSRPVRTSVRIARQERAALFVRCARYRLRGRRVCTRAETWMTKHFFKVKDSKYDI